MISNTRQFKLSDYILRTCAHFSLIIALSASFGVATLAQTASRPDRGVRPVGSYSVSDIENISLTNGNMNLSIPLAALPPIAGGDLSWVLRAEYSSKLWDRVGAEASAIPPLSGYTEHTLQLGEGPWRIGVAYRLSIHHVNADFTGGPDPNDPQDLLGWTAYRWKMVLTTPDGAKHELRPMDYPSYPGELDWRKGYYKDTPAADSINATMRYYSFDGSYLWAKIEPFPAGGGPQNWSVYLPDGTIVEHSNGIQRIKDTNGNKIKIFTTVDGAGRTTAHYQDELTGREILVGYNPATDTSGAHYQTVGGAWVTIEINYGTTRVYGMTYRTGDICLSERLVDTDITVIRSIVLPQTKPGAPRQQFTFSYNSDTTDSVSIQRRLPGCTGTDETITNPSHGWGSLSQMTTPLGATVEYAYQLDGVHQRFVDSDKAPRESLTQKRVIHDGATDTWDYAIGIASGEVKESDGSITTETFYSHDPAFAASVGGGDGKAGLVYRTERKLGPSSSPIKHTTVERHWTQLIFNGGNNFGPGGQVGFNTVVDAEYTTLHDSNGAPVKMSAKTFQHDYNGNITQIIEYDCFDPNLVSRDAAGVPTGVPAGATVLRVTNNSHYNQATDSTSANVYAKQTLPSGAPLILNALQQTTVGDSQTRFSYDGQPYGAPPTSGDLTKESRWDNINGQWLDTTYIYDSFGNRTSATDPSGHSTQYCYEDATHANQTKVVVNPGTSSATEQSTTMVYDYSTGALLSRTDPNGGTTETDYTNQLLGTPDPYLRPGVVTGSSVTSYVNGATHTNQRHKVKTIYDDNARQVIVESDINTSGDYKLKLRTTTDQLGRTILVEKNEDGTSDYTISNQTVYVQMGKITMASNPRRSGGATIDGWVRTTRDDLGRMIEVATFSNAAQPPATGTNANWTGSVTTTYNANETTVKDQANKERRSVANALGHLTRMIENPNSTPSYTTDYTYDQLGNLRKAVQGSQTRFFLFNSLSRLIRTRNPEQEVNTNLSPITDPVTNNSQWSIAFSYFPNGNLQSKTNARNITTGYTYDRTNRNLTVDYSDTAVSPDITRVYDTAPVNGMGRLHKAYAGGNETQGTQVERYEVSDYGPTGRPLKIHQSFKTGGAWSGAYSTERKYDLAGNPTWQQYPSGRTVDWAYDDAGRLNTFKGTLGGTSRDYVLGTTYNAAGGRTREQFGTSTNIYHHLSYTSRGHLFDTRIGTGAVNDGSAPSWNRGALRIYYSSNWAYGNGGADNNGNVYRVDHFIPLDVNVSQWTMSSDYYGYDAFNRISSVAENKLSSGQGEQSVFRQDYAYDRWGNRMISFSDVPGAFNLPFNVDAATNRLMAPNSSISYDKDGNQTNDGYSGGGSRSYDAENRMTAAQGHAYAYDADGRRVRRAISGGQTHWQVFGVAGELVAEYAAGAQPTAPLKEYGYRGGQLLIIAESGSGGGVSFVKPASKSGVDIGKKTDRAVEGNARGPFVVDEPFADLEFNEDSGSTTADVSSDNNTETLIDGIAGTTAEGRGNAPSANGVGGELLVEHPAGAAPNAPEKEYGYRGGRSIVTAQSVVSVNPGAYQTPDPGQGGEAVGPRSNIGHDSTTSSIGATLGAFSKTKTCLWNAFQNVPGTKTRVTLKFDWSFGGNVSAAIPDSSGSGSAQARIDIDYSINNGSSWSSAMQPREVAVAVGGGESNSDSVNLGGSESINLPNPGSIDITQIKVRDRIYAQASVSAGIFPGGNNSNASSTVTISNIHLEVETDTTAPVISNVAAGGITASGATITWTTNENSDSQVEYGPTTAYGQSTTLNPALVTAHSQGLSGLTSGTLYHYRVKSRDAGGNLAVSGDFSFATPDITPPVISNVAAGSITATSATITWTTNENSDSQVEYGTTTSYGQSTALNPALVTAHSQGLSGLTPGTLYHYRVKSRDAAGNLAVSGDFSFTTAPDTTPPTSASFSPAAGATNVNADANVTVTFSEAMDAATLNGSTVDLRDPSNALVSATISYNAASFTATLDPTAPLAAGVTYTARVRGGSTDPRVKDVAGNALTADLTWTFTTAQSGSGGVKWLVTDHLGSTRIMIDETGSLEGIKRHDYLPFGEELSAGVGIRSASNGYGADSTRQKFTSKERDSETGLDYFEARYYASKQGRFTSPDEFTGGPDDLFDFVDAASENPTLYADLTEPQSLNKYQYCYNNPLSFIDIDGHKGWREWLKTGLEVASYIPGPIGTGASLVQAGVALAQGDYKGAALAAAGAIPGGKVLAKVGAAVAGVAAAVVVVNKVAKVADKAGDVGKAVDKGADVSKGIANKGGRFGDLDKAKQAGEVGHHMPQNAANRSSGISRNDGPALGMTTTDHAKTRTFAGRGNAAMRQDAGLTPRQRLAKDARDVKKNFGRKYNEGLQQTIEYAQTLPEFKKP